MSWAPFVAVTLFLMTAIPIYMAVIVVLSSIAVAMTVMSTTVHAWLSYVLILTFSSGMMILFMYAASLTPNERPMNKWSMLTLAPILTVSMLEPATQKTTTKMKVFSTKEIFGGGLSMLLLFMVTMTFLGASPSYPLSSHF